MKKTHRMSRENKIGLAMLITTAAGFAALFTAAVKIDASNGITPSESMCNNGFSAFCVTERPAVPVRLIGKCGGQIFAAKEESAFPADCDWIEPIKTEEESN